MANFSNIFGIVDLTTDELAKLNSKELDFILSASFILNDIRFYWSLMARSPVDGGQTDLGAMQMVRWLWCTRKLASVVYDAVETLDHMSGKVPQAKNNSPVLGKSLRKSPIFSAAREYRNRAAHHFTKAEIAANLSGFAASAKHRVFAHEQHGNSVSEFSEQIFTIPTLNKIAPGSSLEDLNDWCRQSSNEIMHFCGKTIADIIIDRFPNRMFDQRAIAIANEAENLAHRWPLFLIVDRKDRPSVS